MAKKRAGTDVFCALADPTRRRILELLSEGDQPVNELVRAFSMSQPSISEHLRILRQAGLVVAVKTGRQRIYSKLPIQLEQLGEWLTRLRLTASTTSTEALKDPVESGPSARHLAMEID